MIDVITKSYFVKKEDEGKYLKVPFVVSKDVAKVEINYNYQKNIITATKKQVFKKNQSIIDFSINAPKSQYLGSSGSNRSDLYFSLNESSVGFMNPKIMEGEWVIFLGAYKVPDEGIEVTYTFKFEKKERKLLKGDTHTHSTGSDGSLDLPLLVATAKNIGLDFLMITDHNNYHTDTGSFSTNDFTLIPGVEWTQYKGHANFWNMEEAISDTFVTTNDNETKSYIDKAKSEGAILSLNHPFCHDCPWLWSFDLAFDVVEVWNGGTYPDSNAKAIDWWHNELCQGRHIPISAGSDFHAFEPLRMPGYPTTQVLAHGNNSNDILEAILQGHAFLTLSPNGPCLDLSKSSALLGDSYSKNQDLTISFNHLKHKQIVKLITNNSCIEYPVEPNQIQQTIEFNTEEKQFVRFEIWGPLGHDSLIPDDQLLLLTNPIYIQ